MSTKGTKRSKPYKKIRKMIRPIGRLPELKHGFALMPAMGMDSIGTAWREYDLVGQIVPGAGINARIGRRIEVHSVRFRGVLAGGAVGAGGLDEYYNNVRILFYVMHQARTAATTPCATAGYVINTPLNKNYMPGLTKVLRDDLIGITNMPYGANACSPGTREIDHYVKFKRPLLVEYTTDGMNSNQTQIFVSVVSDSGAVPHCGFTSGYYEMKFTDV